MCYWKNRRHWRSHALGALCAVGVALLSDLGCSGERPPQGGSPIAGTALGELVPRIQGAVRNQAVLLLGLSETLSLLSSRPLDERVWLPVAPGVPPPSAPTPEPEGGTGAEPPGDSPASSAVSEDSLEFPQLHFTPVVTSSGVSALSPDGTMAVVSGAGKAAPALDADPVTRALVLDFLELSMLRRELRDAYIARAIEREDCARFSSVADADAHLQEYASEGILPGNFALRTDPATATCSVIDLRPLHAQALYGYLSERAATLRKHMAKRRYYPHFVYDGVDIAE
jgi:hypothetical protein